jgi:hypothetical protein
MCKITPKRYAGCYHIYPVTTFCEKSGVNSAFDGELAPYPHCKHATLSKMVTVEGTCESCRNADIQKQQEDMEHIINEVSKMNIYK